jgi:hypothetical protein
MSMNAYLAIGIAEGFEVAESQEQFIEAWQFLIDSGLAWRLQGWYGRTASHLIGEGLCQEPDPARVKLTLMPRSGRPCDEQSRHPGLCSS